MNYSGYTIIKIVAKDGKRDGAVLRRINFKDERIEEYNMIKFAHHLRTTKQELFNATIYRDGKIVPLNGKEVRETTIARLYPVKVQDKSKASVLAVCHASENVIQVPNWRHVNPKNPRKPHERDFGAGFYMCETSDQWYPIGLYAGFGDRIKRIVLNEYTLDLTGLNILRLRANLVWVMVIAAHRHENAGNTVERHHWHWLRNAICEAVKQYDLVIGPISDDDMYTVLDDFIDGKVSEGYVIDSVNYMKYPQQYVSTSDKADRQIKHIKHRGLLPNEALKAKNNRDLSQKKMKADIVERRYKERDEVRKGIMRGRLFKDIVDSHLMGLEEKPEHVRKQYIYNLVERWFRDGKC
jgi:hypothetical protein